MSFSKYDIWFLLRACIDLRVIHSSGKAPRLTPAHFIAEQILFMRGYFSKVDRLNNDRLNNFYHKVSDLLDTYLVQPRYVEGKQICNILVMMGALPF